MFGGPPCPIVPNMQAHRKQEAPREPIPAHQLSVHRSFVVQLYVPTEPQAEVWAGRVEHITSGQRQRFGSLAELAGIVEKLMGNRPDSADTG